MLKELPLKPHDHISEGICISIIFPVLRRVSHENCHCSAVCNPGMASRLHTFPAACSWWANFSAMRWQQWVWTLTHRLCSSLSCSWAPWFRTWLWGNAICINTCWWYIITPSCRIFSDFRRCISHRNAIPQLKSQVLQVFPRVCYLTFLKCPLLSPRISLSYRNIQQIVRFKKHRVCTSCFTFVVLRVWRWFHIEFWPQDLILWWVFPCALAI